MIIAVTGRTGSGKSAVADLFVRLGARRIDADRIGREVWENDPIVRGRIAAALGPSVLGPDGEIDRRLLGKIVFEDTEKLRAFDGIVQPILKERIRGEIRSARGEGGPDRVLDAALLFAWGLEAEVDRVVLVTAPPEIRAGRIASRHRLGEAEAARRAERQETGEGEAARSDYVIANEGTLGDLEEKARAVWREIHSGRPCGQGRTRDVGHE